jgi:microsomal dipeptidase-like Zn-dependent dipeptidase
VYQQLATYLSQRGISRQTIEKLFYRNALRLITTVL